MKMLRSKLYDLEMQKRRDETDKLDESKAGYFLRQPDSLVRHAALSPDQRSPHEVFVLATSTRFSMATSIRSFAPT